MAAPVFYTTEEAAALLRRGKRTLETWRRDSRGPAYIKDGETILYPDWSIAAWAKACLVTTSP